MTDLWTTVLAIAGVIGTLAGVVITNRANAATARAALAEADRKEQRTAALHAATLLIAGIDHHRAAMWKRQHAQLTGADERRCRELRDASHVTRAAISQPLAAVQILLPVVAAQARVAVDATYAIRDVEDLEDLGAARSVAHLATARLTDEVTAALTATEGTTTR